MFKAVIEAEKFRDSVEVISTLVDEARLKLKSEGISVKAVDPANVAMVSFELSRDAFDTFEATEGEIGIDLKKINGILEMADKLDRVELELDEGSHKLVIRIGKLSYTVSLLDPSSIRKEPKVPVLELPAHVAIKGEELKRAIKASEKVSDYIRMGVQGEVFFIEAEGDTDRVRVELARDQLIDLKPGDASSLFSLDYLSDLSKVIAKAEKIELSLGKDFPLKLRFMVAGDKGEVNYLLAPRVESE